jgi:hypothetical protein
MSKRAVDLSLEELAAMGANAALRASNAASDAGLTVGGTVDFADDDQPISSLAERQPSGTVTLLDAPARTPSRRKASNKSSNKTAASAARPNTH